VAERYAKPHQLPPRLGNIPHIGFEFARLRRLTTTLFIGALENSTSLMGCASNRRAIGVTRAVPKRVLTKFFEGFHTRVEGGHRFGDHCNRSLVGPQSSGSSV
jgi:hypothetical protein